METRAEILFDEQIGSFRIIGIPLAVYIGHPRNMTEFNPFKDVFDFQGTLICYAEEGDGDYLPEGYLWYGLSYAHVDEPLAVSYLEAKNIVKHFEHVREEDGKKKYDIIFRISKLYLYGCEGDYEINWHDEVVTISKETFEKYRPLYEYLAKNSATRDSKLPIPERLKPLVPLLEEEPGSITDLSIFLFVCSCDGLLPNDFKSIKLVAVYPTSKAILRRG